ncbi:hypothetical protein EF384_05375 [Aerococcus agrisoli]|uniref:Uncharacterized protein n=1 Tax=Aerococcus agrisoli TaxID=2487350 RepID=A0A3N4GMZ1_9LACT|nr:hypothetical protein EF384_05375 [Aerococcus agrisoli]
MFAKLGKNCDSTMRFYSGRFRILVQNEMPFGTSSRYLYTIKSHSVQPANVLQNGNPFSTAPDFYTE